MRAIRIDIGPWSAKAGTCIVAYHFCLDGASDASPRAFPATLRIELDVSTAIALLFAREPKEAKH